MIGSFLSILSNDFKFVSFQKNHLAPFEDVHETDRNELCSAFCSNLQKGGVN